MTDRPLRDPSSMEEFIDTKSLTFRTDVSNTQQQQRVDANAFREFQESIDVDLMIRSAPRFLRRFVHEF